MRWWYPHGYQRIGRNDLQFCSVSGAEWVDGYVVSADLCAGTITLWANGAAAQIVDTGLTADGERITAIHAVSDSEFIIGGFYGVYRIVAEQHVYRRSFSIIAK